MITFESTSFNKTSYDKYGIYIVRNALPTNIVKEWQEEWDQFYKATLANGRNVHQANPVEL